MSISTYFGAFLDGFTAAGLARELTIPGEPVLGLAPVSGTLPGTLVSDLRSSPWPLYVGQGDFKRRVLQVRLDTESRTMFFLTESGEVQEVQIEETSLHDSFISASHRHVT